MAIPTALLQGVRRLDPLPATLNRLVKALNDENVGAAQIGEIVQFDHAIVAGILRAVNSAAYGGYSRTETVRDAVTRLGKSRIINIVLGDHLKSLHVDAPLYDLSEDELWQHAAATSIAVREIGRECPKAGLAESAAIAGLLHDVGKLIMVRYLKADYKDILQRRDEREVTFVQAERDLFGCDHAEVGGEIARHWGFPDEIRESIARHHEVPLRDSTPIIDAVVMANMVAKTLGTGLGAEGLDLCVDRGCRDRLKLDFTKFSHVCINTLTALEELRGIHGLRTA
jgi:putative nucleotidyltransferase with HDIG domain